jgi:hypothetical protein
MGFIFGAIKIKIHFPHQMMVELKFSIVLSEICSGTALSCGRHKYINLSAALYQKDFNWKNEN